MREIRDIRVPRRRSAVVPWLVGLIVFVLLIWLVSGLTKADELESAREGDLGAALRIETPALG